MLPFSFKNANGAMGPVLVMEIARMRSEAEDGREDRSVSALQLKGDGAKSLRYNLVFFGTFPRVTLLRG